MNNSEFPENKKESTSAACITALLLCGIYGSFLAHPITLITADLGRHVKNGEILLRGISSVPSLNQNISVVGRLLRHNFYSYTEPDFPLVNHHWASGVLFYVIWEWFGWVGVHILFIAISLATFLIFYVIAVKHSGTGVAALAALLVIPLLAERTEIRPEAFSYLFCGIFLWILLRFRAGMLSFRTAAIVLFSLEALWVNTHIYFFLGPLIIGAFLAESLLSRATAKTVLRWIALLGLILLAGLLNPFGIKAITYPFTILQDYGYRLAENQPVWFMEKLMQNPNFVIFKLVFWTGAIALVALPFIAYGASRLAKGIREYTIRYPRQNIASLLLFAGTSTMAWLQIRNFALFGFFALPFMAGAFTNVFQEAWERHRRELAAVSLAIVTIISFIAFSGDVQKFFPHWLKFGFGLEMGDSAAAGFFKRERLTGPILNNYDIGGYLIFHLFPDERVFVDNRPEAYSVSFFQETYVPLQESEEDWKSALERYKFNAIFFSHRDATPWGQHFLIARIQDPEWAPVFADTRAIIFLRNTEANSSVIKKYAIPRENFSVTTR
jgi:hypothetical protein